jgi:hypothetical protein
MKTIKALRKWTKGYPLSSKERHMLDELVMNLKIAGMTLLIGLVVVLLLAQPGCFEEKISPEHLQQP